MSEDCICKCNANWILLIKWTIYGLTTRSLSTLEIMSLLNLNSCHPVGIKDRWIRFIVSTHYALRSMICHKMILSKHFSTLICDLILSGYKKQDVNSHGCFMPYADDFLMLQKNSLLQPNNLPSQYKHLMYYIHRGMYNKNRMGIH